MEIGNVSDATSGNTTAQRDPTVEYLTNTTAVA